ncbi:MAG: septal ring lytic transglycosylase RlpA family protein [Betaproteobacteria bacterium]|nr:septal ring lytic transglycosylase RlpA family protein [Betaproteobacteria bacterium]
MSRETQPPQRNARGAKNSFSFFALRLLLALAPALILAACGSAPKRAAVERNTAVITPKPAPAATAPRGSGGGYYQDDGPGDNPPANLDQIEDAEPKLEPLHRFANNPYTVFGLQYVPYKTLAPYRQRGIGSWYGRKFHGQRTSGGEPYDMYAMSAAHATLPIPSYARVTNLANGRSVIVRVNDRGPFHSGRLVDLSYAAAYKLGYAGAGSASVEVEAITREDLPMIAARRRQAIPPVTAAAAPRANEAQPVAETQALAPVIPAAASALQPESAKPVQAIPVDAEASGIYLQLGAFSGRDNAENFRIRVYQQLAWLNDAIQVYSRDGMFRLHLGPYRSRDEANGMADKIREALQFKPVVVVR